MSATSTAWVVVAAALGSAFLTTAGTFALDARRARRAAKMNQESDLKTACVQIISSAQKLSHRAGALHETMITRSGLGEGINVTLGLRKPADQLELIDYLMLDMGPMLAAQAVVWLAGDEKLITAASDVVLCAGDVVAKSTTLPEDRRPVEEGSGLDRLKVQVRGLRPVPRDPEVEAMRNSALRELGRTCWIFGQVMRARLGVSDVGALLRAFPGFHDQDVAGHTTAEDSPASP